MNPFLLILDSGAVSFYNKFVKKNTRGAPGRSFRYRKGESHSYLDSEEFIAYRDAYIEYVRKVGKYMAGYINMDIINNAEESYKSLKYMEKKGVKPLPVFHLGGDINWLKRYIKEGYEYICIGGIVPNRFATVKPILDKIWSDILTDSNGMPKIKVHGLAVTSFHLLKRYPWYSTDSASWRKAGAYGKIFIPRRKGNGWDFNKTPCALKFTHTSAKINHRDYHSMQEDGKKWALDWLKFIDVPLGACNEKGELTEYGVISHHAARGIANMKYHYLLSRSLPEFPWQFKITERKSLL